jgi:hypothetical protein
VSSKEAGDGMGEMGEREEMWEDEGREELE